MPLIHQNAGRGVLHDRATVRRNKVMGELRVEGGLYWLGWLATGAMVLSIVGMAFGLTSAGQ
jgi:hypothetical protein